MLAFRDDIDTVDELSTERMNFRTKPRIKQTIQRAAALSGVDDSAFAMNAAYRSALETIAAHEHTMLKAVDHQAFFDAVDNPSPPNAKLLAAAARHREIVKTD